MNLVTAYLPLALLFGACQSASGEEASPAAEGRAETWETRGVVKRVERERNMVSVTHEEIPGYMRAMTMPFWMDSEELFEGLAVGQTIEFTFRRAEDGKHYIVRIHR